MNVDLAWLFRPEIGLTACVAVMPVLTACFWAVGILRWCRSRPLSHEHPSVSVVVAARNEENLIASCIKALAELDYPDDHLDVTVVDDHSTDGTLAEAQRATRAHGSRVRVLSAPPCSPDVGPKKHALAHGVAQSCGKILLFTDADCIVRPGWVRAMVAQYDQRTGAVVGAMLPPARACGRGMLYRLERCLVGYTSAAAIGFGVPASACGGNLSVRRRAFEDVGGFAHADLPCGDDDLTVQEIAARGWSVRFASGAASVVTDQRLPNLKRHLHAAARHQSTMRYYPLRWRLAYLLSILSQAFFVALAAFSILVMPELLPFVGAVFLARVVTEGLAVSAFCCRLGERLPWWQVAAAEIALPFYTLFRPLLLLLTTFSWQGRTHRTLAPSPIAPPAP